MDIKKFKSLIVLLVVFPVTAISKPPVEIQYLMNEPLSLFDFGLIRLEEDLKDNSNGSMIPKSMMASFARVTSKSLYKFPTVKYDWDRNLLKLQIEYALVFGLAVPQPPEKFDERKAGKALCRETVKHVRVRLGSPSGLGDYFSHFGYTKAGRPKALEATLLESTEIVVLTRMSMEERTINMCRASLAGGKITYDE